MHFNIFFKEKEPTSSLETRSPLFPDRGYSNTNWILAVSACVRTLFSLFKPVVKGKNVFKKYTILDGQDKNSVKPLFNTDSEGPIESVHINGVSVLSGFQ